MKVDCKLFPRWASLYVDGRLPGRARTAVAAHLARCGPCAARMDRYRAGLARLRPPLLAHGLVAADITRELEPGEQPALWPRLLSLLGLALLLAALLAAAFLLGWRFAGGPWPPLRP